MPTIKIPDEIKEELVLLAAGVENIHLMIKLKDMAHNINVEGQTLAETLPLNSRGLFYCHMSHESYGFTDTKENINYSPERAMRLWPKTLGTIENAQDLIQRGELMNVVYEKVSGNTTYGDGLKYIGRGYLNVTGKYNYGKVNQYCSIDAINNPELLEQDRYAWESSLAFLHFDDNLKDTLLNVDLRGSTKEINGGTNGLEHRSELWTKVLAVLNGEWDDAYPISKHDKNFSVKILQLWLALMGDDSIVIDGHWGNGTSRSILEVFDSTIDEFTESEFEAMVNSISALLMVHYKGLGQ